MFVSLGQWISSDYILGIFDIEYWKECYLFLPYILLVGPVLGSKGIIKFLLRYGCHFQKVNNLLRRIKNRRKWLKTQTMH